ncbi:MAG: AarF/ABC1/UbiB kinase family protein, partial [Cyanobacteriota bacterium]
ALVSSAALQEQLDVEGLLDQVIDFLFSPSGGLLRRQLVEAMVERMDNLAWRMTLRIGRRLPVRLLPPGLRERQSSPEALDPRPLLDLEPVRQLMVILKDLPGFEPRLLLQRLPRLVGEPDLRRMGAEVARGLAERGVVRLLRDVLVTPAAELAGGGGARA